MSSIDLEAHQNLAGLVTRAFERCRSLPPCEVSALRPHLRIGIDALDRGELRAVQRVAGEWRPTEWVKKLILLEFLTAPHAVIGGPQDRVKAYDKLGLKFDGWSESDFARSGVRVVPGAVVRRGAYVAPGAVLMPCFVNIGAHVGANTMIDTWATVGSCAQVGERCHISGGAGIGGVLEPIGDRPVVIEDDVFVGARAEVAEGVLVRRGAVISMGVHLGRSTPIIDRTTGAVSYGEIPENAVVVPGGRRAGGSNELTTYAAIIIKYADARTRSKTALNDLVRDIPQ